MYHTFLVVTVKKWLKSVYIYGSYRKIKTGLSLFWTILYGVHCQAAAAPYVYHRREAFLLVN